MPKGGVSYHDSPPFDFSPVNQPSGWSEMAFLRIVISLQVIGGARSF
jgi:hypothetical protein